MFGINEDRIDELEDMLEYLYQFANLHMSFANSDDPMAKKIKEHFKPTMRISDIPVRINKNMPLNGFGIYDDEHDAFIGYNVTENDIDKIMERNMEIPK